MLSSGNSIVQATKAFSTDDYQTLQILLHPFNRIVTTPHVLTEVSNLASQIDERRRAELFAAFSAGIAVLSEEHVASREISHSREFLRFGLTDAAIARIARDKLLVLTVDLPLWVFLSGQRIDVINFNHIRHLNWR